MQIAVEIAGFTMGEADMLRKAMGKKSPEVMAKQKARFVDGAEARGFGRDKPAELWEYIEPFAGYGFNKSHSVAYAMLAYKTAYLKAHYPVPFMAAMLTSEMSSKDNVSKYIQECREMGVSVLPPHVNDSDWSFSVHGETMRFGLGAVKGIGDAAVEAILEARRRVGKFRDLVHFACEVDPKAVNHRVFEALIKSGSFDGLGANRRALDAALDPILSYAQARYRDREIGQESLFGSGNGEEELAPRADSALPEWDDRERLQYEKEALGFYLTGHPLAEYSDEIAKVATHTVGGVASGVEGSVTLGGLATQIKRVTIKSGKNAGRLMARFVLEDLDGRVAIAVFADQLQRFGHLLHEDAALLVRGTIRERGAEPEMNVEEIRSLEGILGDVVTQVQLFVGQTMPTATLLELRDHLTERSGTVPVVFRIPLEDCEVTISSGEQFRVAPDDALTHSLERLLGPGTVRCQTGRPEPVVH